MRKSAFLIAACLLLLVAPYEAANIVYIYIYIYIFIFIYLFIYIHLYIILCFFLFFCTVYCNIMAQHKQKNAPLLN